MDRNVLERMTAPLEHMLRNAIAHGVESPAERDRAGKPDEGRCGSRSAAKDGSRAQGLRRRRGLDRDAIRARRSSAA